MEHYTNDYIVTCQKGPYVTEEDILVYKRLFSYKNEDGTTSYYALPTWSYELPREIPRPYVKTLYCHCTEEEINAENEDAAKYGIKYTKTKQDAVTFNSVFRLNGEKAIIVDETAGSFTIGGYINVSNTCCGNDVFKAYIPKGTKYLLDNDLEHAYVEELYITYQGEDLSVHRNDNEWEKLLKPIVESIGKDNIMAGWFYTQEGKFIHPSDYQNNKSDGIIGVVVGEEDGSYIVASVKWRYHLTKDIVCDSEYLTGKYGLEWSIPTREFLVETVCRNIDKNNYSFIKLDGCAPLCGNILCHGDDGKIILCISPYQQYKVGDTDFVEMYLTKVKR